MLAGCCSPASPINCLIRCCRKPFVGVVGAVVVVVVGGGGAVAVIVVAGVVVVAICSSGRRDCVFKIVFGGHSQR